MTLAQMFAFVNKKTYFSKDDDEIWDAISEASSTLFLKVVAENSGFFLVWDTSSLLLTANKEEYALPATVGEIVRLREKLLVTDPWAVIEPTDVNSQSFTDSQFNSLDGSLDSELSQFEYYGPYLNQADAITAAQAQKIRIEPPPVDTRMTELVYIAKFLDITGQESVLVIPTEGHGVIKNDAVASLLIANDDDNAQNFIGQARENERWFLKWIRNRQFQRVRQIEPYVEDMD